MAAGGTSNRSAQGGGTSANMNGHGPRPRILRIGVLLGGKIVEERLIRDRIPVTIGQSMKNTFSIPIDGLPMEFTLFALDEGKYYLRFLNKMDGRLSDAGNEVQTLDALKQRGAVQGGSGGQDYWQVPLGDQSRGKLSFGDLTVLFQFVAEPPRAPKPMLPASVRGTFADRIDPRLAVIVGASIVAHFAVALIAWLNDVPEDGMAERAYHLSFQEDKYQVTTEPDPIPVKDSGSAAGSAAPVPEKAPDKGSSKPNEKPNKDPVGQGRDSTTAPTLSEDDAAALADLVSGEGSNARTEGDMDGRRPGADLGDQIASVRDGGRTVAIGGGSGRGTRDGGGTRVGTGSGPGIGNTSGPVAGAGGTGTERGPVGRISVSDKQSFDDSDLSPDAVLKKIQSAYMAGIKHCYTNYLKKEATARGKVKLTLTVNESGRVTDGGAKGFAGEVDSCIGNLMHSWTFPKPKDKDGEATEASFAISLQLVPD